jgi:hypothetical protein
MKRVLLYFILLMAVVLAATVAYVSISGLDGDLTAENVFTANL